MRRLTRCAIAIPALIVLFIIGGEALFRHKAPAIYSEGGNGLWLSHAWVGGEKTMEDYEELAGLLRDLGTADAYVHVGPFRSDGTVDRDKIRFAVEFLNNMKTIAPGVRLQAWLGQVEASAGGPLDLSDEDVRLQMIVTAKSFLDLGFDGIHYDIEPIYSGDEYFLELLRETHQLTGACGAKLSVAACRPEPISGLEGFLRIFSRSPGYWRRDYYVDVAREVDQVAVMTYDTAIPVPFVYGEMVSWMVRWSVDQGIPDLLVGVPTYDGTITHYPWVENVDTTLIGLKRGLARLDKDDGSKVGTAVYAEWTTSAQEREELRREWIGGKGD